MDRLAGKVAIITGASRGMGAHEARLFASEGAAVVVCDLLDARGEAVAAEIVAAGGRAIYRHLDVTDEAAWGAVVAYVLEWQGRLDILLNNAGINIRGNIAETLPADWAKVLGVNLSGPLLGMRAVAPAMKAGGGGSVINIASVAGIRASRSAAYTTSKWALRGLSRVAAVEFASSGIRVNTICPGVVPTELNAGQPYLELATKRTPLRRLASADDVAKAALFLASDDAKFITGTDVIVDGGITVQDPGSAQFDER